MTAAAAIGAASAGVLVLASAAASRAVVGATSAARARARLPVERLDPVGPRAPRWLVSRLTDAACPWPADRAWLVWLLSTTTVVLGALAVGGPALALLAGALAVLAPVAVLWSLRGRRDRLIERALPDALEAIARAVRSGASLRQALQEAAGTTADSVVGGDLRAVVAAADQGEPLVHALDGWSRRRPLAGVRLTVAALALGTTTGGTHARAVDGVAATLRDRLALERELAALSSQARLSAIVIALAPIGFAALAIGSDARTADFLLRTPTGLACLAGGLALDGLAALWMARLTRSVGP
jgi:tight adherence protein B